MPAVTSGDGISSPGDLGEFQTEASPQIVLSVGGTNLRVKSVDTEVDIGIEMLRGNTLEASGWAVTEVAYSGSLAFHGDVAAEVNALMTEDGVVPMEGVTLTVTHAGGRAESFENVFMGNQQYSMSEGDVSETTYEWVAMSSSKGGTGGTGA